MTVLLITIPYLLVLLLIQRLTAGRGSNDTFFRGERRSPWWAVAFGMLGASLSGVTFVSVPGMVRASAMTYLQMCMGFVPGYILVACVLLPVYYRLRLTSIYTYLQQRFDRATYRTGASFFLLSKLLGAGVRLYLATLVFQQLVMQQMGIPFWMTVSVLLLVIWLYTHVGGIHTIVWTDCLQTAVLLAALVLIVRSILVAEGWSMADAIQVIRESPMSRVFVTDDWRSPQHLMKQLLSGTFIVVVMTGLDQDMMQKNLTCRTLRESQKNMVVNGLLYLPVNLLFLGLGVLMYTFAANEGLALPAKGDEVLPMLCGGGWLGNGTLALFSVGIMASALSSADSALTALTTSACVDILGDADDMSLRRRVHLMMVGLLLVTILCIEASGSTSVINVVYTIASYTYGPLLGLFAFCLLIPERFKFSRQGCAQAKLFGVPWVVWICVMSPLVSFFVAAFCEAYFDYHFGYELLLMNGSLTFAGLLALSKKEK